jgi:hypothetical protein
MKRSPRVYSQIPNPAQKAVHDTVEGCRGLALADLARAALMDTANGRRRLESSASSWNKRADFIQDLADNSEARQAVAAAEWNDGEAAAQPRNDQNSGEA